MKMQTISHCKPLCSLDSGHLLVSRQNRLYSFDLSTHGMEFLAEIPTSGMQTICGKSKILSRLARLGVHTAIRSRDRVYFAFDRCIFSYDIQKRSVQLDGALARGSRPLNFSAIENIKGFEDAVLYGEYFLNDQYGPVNIFKKTVQGWEVAYTFPEKTIEHIHNIIADPYQQCVWILTGDFGDSACIWKATENFTKVEPVLRGSQQFRACVAFPTPMGLLYATDSQIEKNHIRLLKSTEGQAMPQSIAEINGPSIYGCRLKDFYVFSTSTESALSDGSSLWQMLDRKKGPGIIEDQAEILVFDQNFKLVFHHSNRKDGLPYLPFQFGTITFPSGMEQGNILASFNIAVKKNDFSMELRSF